MKFEIEKAVEVLSGTPAVVRALLGNLSNDWIDFPSAENNWNPFDIVGHLIHAEDTDWIPRARIILARGENPQFEAFDRFAQFELSKGKTLAQLLDEFAAAREKNIGILTDWNLTDEHLKLKGLHPELGAVTLAQLLSTWVVHDLTHLRQLATVLANRYGENVGVWKNYLSILQ